MKKSLLSILLFSSLLIFSPFALSFGQTVEKLEKIERDIEAEKKLREAIEAKPEAPEVKEEAAPEQIAPEEQEKVLIKRISVTSVTLVSQEEINKIIRPFENQELTMPEMQRIADLITDAYRQKGYVTSRAFLPPQKITEGVLELRVVEGLTGDIDIQGNKFFSTRVLRKRITLKKDQPFNYDKLRINLTKINERPDRQVKAVLVPGKEAGKTDILLNVEDHLPLHLGLNYDNFGSRYVDHDRFRLTLTHNNLSGWDDILSIQYQLSEGENYRLNSLRYLFPVSNELELIFLAAQSKLRLKKEFEELNARGKSRLYSIMANRSMIDEQDLDFDLNLGFDYKDIFNFQNNIETSRDRVRILRFGFFLDSTDARGRTLVTNDLSFGIPRIMSGLKPKDARASRAGSGGKFLTNTLNALRLHRMPFNSRLLWKNQLQFTSYNLPSSEQFQIGGIVNVRGYPSAEAIGDQGYSSTIEWSFPLYFIPRDVDFPFSKGKIYDALRFVAFFDWANAHLNSPGIGEEKSRTLRAAGFGIRLDLPEEFSARIDIGFPLDSSPSDGEHTHIWTEVFKSF